MIVRFSLIICMSAVSIVFGFCNAGETRSEKSDSKQSNGQLAPVEANSPSGIVNASHNFSGQSLAANSVSDDGFSKDNLSYSLAETHPTKIQSVSGISKDSHYLIDNLPRGYVKDGSVDYTSFLQEAIDSHKNLVFPGFPLLVNDSGLKIKSDKVLTFLKGSVLTLKPSAKKSYAILDLVNAKNVLIYNPVIIGDRSGHLGIEGEWGMGISIKASSDIKIYNPIISECWGDGIYIGQSDGRGCDNIQIRGAQLRKNRRDGISIISVDGLLLENTYAGYNDGTKPMTGINFEPNNPDCELKNIRVINPVTERNGSRGIQIVNRRMLGLKDKESDISIINHRDEGSPSNAFKLACNPTDEIIGKMYGIVKIENPTWVNSKKDIPIDVSSNQINYKLTIYSPAIINTAGNSLSNPEIFSLLMKQKHRVNLSIVN